MKKILLGMILAILFISNASAESQRYGQNPDEWRIFTKEKGEITNYFTSGVILSGNGMKTGYRLNLLPLNKGATTIKWSMNFNEFYAIYVEVYTTKGKRILRYTSLDEDIGHKGKYISFGLGSHSRTGRDHIITRELQKDLEKFEAGNKILSITAFLVRGSGKIYSIKTDDFAVSLENDEIMIEEANVHPNSHWSIFTKDKGTIKSSRYRYTETGIKLSGKGMKTGYALSFPTLNDNFKTVGWDMKYHENYAIYFLVKTTNGVKYLRYSSLNYDKGIHGRYISFGLGAISKDGKWHSFRRNLQKDLNKFEPGSKILSIQSFMIRGSGWVDNIKAIKDSSLTPIDNFDSEKFDKLLKVAVDRYYSGDEASIIDTEYARIKYIYYSDISGDNDSISIYTLSSNQTKLKEIFTTSGEIESISLSNIKFNDNHTRMTFSVRYGATTNIFEYEVLL
ncbi:MAG: hypothetical protein KAG56_08500 [Sulfurovaceae bacterium]|nr:hypothetical protein [Sulfurovaceae bacterium]